MNNFRTAFASALQALCIAAYAGIEDDIYVRVIRRHPDVRNLETVDTVAWYSEEAVRLDVEPVRAGRRLAIPDGSTAAWIVADERGTNWLVRYDLAPTSNGCTFALAAGEGRLPPDHDYTGYVSILSGTNVLGVVDRHRVNVTWNPTDPCAEAVMPPSEYPPIVAAVQDFLDAAAGQVASNSAAIAARPTFDWVAAYVATNSSGGGVVGVDTNAIVAVAMLDATNNFLPSYPMNGYYAVDEDVGFEGGIYVLDTAEFKEVTIGGVNVVHAVLTNLVAGNGINILKRRDKPIYMVSIDRRAVVSAVESNDFSSITLGGETRTNWPTYLAGGPLFPEFVQASGVRVEQMSQLVLAGPGEFDAGAARLVPLAEEDDPIPVTTWARFINVRSDGLAVPRFSSTDTMVYNAGDPWKGIESSLCPPGFWWREAGPKTGEWAVVIGGYTNLNAVVKSPAADPQVSAYGWVENKDGGLRDSINDYVVSLRGVTGKTCEIFGYDGDWLDGTKTRRDNYWARDVDITFMSPGYIEATGPSAPRFLDKHGTLIDPGHVLYAEHWHVAPGAGKVQFYDDDGVRYERDIVGGLQVPGYDLWIGELDSPLPSSIVPAKFIRPKDEPKLSVVRPDVNLRVWHKASADSRGGLVEGIHVRHGGSRAVWVDVDNVNWSDNSMCTTHTNSGYPFDSAAGSYATCSRYSGTSTFIGGDSSSVVILPIDGQSVVVAVLRLAGGGGVRVIGDVAVDIEDTLKTLTGDPDASLSWCDLEDWPDPTADIGG